MPLGLQAFLSSTSKLTHQITTELLDDIDAIEMKVTKEAV